ncbi:MAG: GIY-YIG nuclease family protein [Patescibacteria group bacterium]|nr:GIY-YIG nuclease family protein [Patescibacteria group bacterium]
MYFTYAIKSMSRKYIYVGMTNDLLRRVSQHQSGHERTTAPYRPFLLLYQEAHPTRIAARKREKYLKSGAGKEWLKNIE